ncbi:MAG TPA: DUF202 domain-containing protein [Chloroflexota bacterium]|nr:DUF202 domain-containing protein [Chloroflexota bacterium]
MSDLETSSRSNLRDHLANERTFLSWIRLSIAITALGFVVARFGIFIAQIFALQRTQGIEPGLSVPFGVALVVAGPVFALLALARFLVAEREIETGQFRHHHGLIYLIIIVTVVMGIGLAAYLTVTASSVAR